MKKSILNIGMVCVLGLSLAACTDNFDSMNQDPMGITNSDPSYVMPYIQEQGAHIASWEYQVGDNLHTNLYAQYFANSASYFNSDNYTYNSGWVTDGFWNNYYSGVLKQVKAVAETVKKLPAYEHLPDHAHICRFVHSHDDRCVWRYTLLGGCNRSQRC